MDKSPPDEPDDLLPQHAALIEASAISSEVAAARGYRSITNRSELERLGFSAPQRIVPCLLVPIHDVHGEAASYQIRPDEPRVFKGKITKYETPKGTTMVLDVPPTAREWLGDPARPLFITEGARKADAAVSLGLCCIAVLGVWNWRGTNAHGGKTALPDWEAIALNGRDVFIVFDSDMMSKDAVRAALARFREFLVSRGAKVKVILLPAGDGGTKTGLDDYLAAGHSVTELLAHATDTVTFPKPIPFGSYEATGHGLVYHKEVRGGTVPVQLTNFTARIITQISTDDGVEQQLSFELEAELNGRIRTFTIAAKQFQGMSWTVEQLGAEGIVFPGMALRDHARAAIQFLSRDIARRQVFAHLGWRKIAGIWVYLHAGGAIGPDGPQPDVEVQLPEALHRYVLPDPPHGEALQKAIRASLAILGVAPGVITVPLLGSVYRSPLGQSDFSTHLTGDTGEGKTELAALCQQHFGAAHDANNLPASWHSTGNALEAIAFAAKDALMTVDDFVPKGSQMDINRLNREAERILRAQANSSGKLRMRADTSLRPPKPPRGLILSTGEETPRGKSLRARLVILELGKGQVEWDRLTVVQEAGRSGLYAQAQSGYLAWLAKDYDQVRASLREQTRELRDRASRGQQHKRTPTVVAGIALGFRYFLRFAVEVGALTPDEAKAIWDRVWKTLGKVAAAQAKFLEAEEPTKRFIDLLVAALSSGRAHVAGKEAEAPTPPEAWGWRESTLPGGSTEWRPLGTCIGWLDGDDLYLEPEASFAAAQHQARDAGETLPINSGTLRRRLRDRGYLLSTDPNRETLTVRRMLAGARREVLHLRAGSLVRRKPDQPDQSTPEDDADADSWSGSWSGSVPDSTLPDAEPDQETRPQTPGTTTRPGSPGQVGQVSGEMKRRRKSEKGETTQRIKI